MTKEEIEAELERCSNDIEYMLRTYVRVKTDDGARPLTEEEVAAAVVRSLFPGVSIMPKRGYKHWWPWTIVSMPRSSGS